MICKHDIIVSGIVLTASYSSLLGYFNVISYILIQILYHSLIIYEYMLRIPLLEAKASNGMHPDCIVKSPDRHTSVLKIVPLVVQVYTMGFVKCFAVFCFILNQSSQL